MSTLARLSRLTGVDRAPALKHFLKQVLWFARDPLRRGVPLALGGRSVLVPARFAQQPWTLYEPPATLRAAGWFEQHPDCVVIDVGCSVALYSLLAVSVAPRATAWGIDSERIGLQSSRWLFRHTDPQRFHVIHGYVGDQPTADLPAADAARRTVEQLERDRVPDEPSLADYLCLDSQATTGIPVHSLDRLFPAPAEPRPHFVKIDVEGAELIVLRGADDFVRRVRPQLLVSVHPSALRGYGLGREDVDSWLRARGYRIEIDVEAHEEHWWCTPDAG